MSVPIVAKRYARALFELALENNQLEAIEADVLALAGLMQHNQDFAGFIRNPLIPSDLRCASLDDLFKGKAQDRTVDFLKFLDQKSRLNQLEVICEGFAVLSREHRNILPVTITSAIALTEDQVNRMKEKLGAQYGKTIQTTLKVNSALVGGFQILVGDQVTDTSIATKLETFRRNVLNA